MYFPTLKSTFHSNFFSFETGLEVLSALICDLLFAVDKIEERKCKFVRQLKWQLYQPFLTGMHKTKFVLRKTSKDNKQNQYNRIAEISVMFHSLSFSSYSKKIAGGIIECDLGYEQHVCHRN